MKFSRLRLSGFKSFVEATDCPLEHGLTGVVGPNGCGKSNLLEALRWVMGESSYKNMRASGMDDVIFSGTAKRPARNMAEVVVTLDNHERTAPVPFNDADVLEISRRIERESGSTYRINGREARARDVQLLFADAATGARSPALVRQGQVGELIGSKPQARRRILEEAAGITGLHTRRHEAELKLRSAEANLARLDDVVAQLDQQLQNLRKQARQAIRYRQLSADIRKLEAASLHIAWREAGIAEAQDRTAVEQSTRALAERTRAASEAARARDAAGEALPPLREAEAVRAAVLQRLDHERVALEREAAQVEERGKELQSRLLQASSDLAREHEILGDTSGTLDKLAAEEASIGEADSAEAERRAEAARLLQAEADRLARAQGAADEAQARLSGILARRGSLAKTIDAETQRLARLEREQSEIAEKRRRLAGETGGEAALSALAAALEQARGAQAAAEAAVAEAEAATRSGRQQEAVARQTFEEARRRAERLGTEVRTLTKLLFVPNADLWPPLLDSITVEPGYEAALSAALGDDIDAPADEAAPLHWRTLDPYDATPPLPDGVAALAGFVNAPAALSRRLALTGVIEPAEGHRLQGLLVPGQRLVSRDGDLWRWDGFVATAEAPTAAAKRLSERNRLGALQKEEEQAAATQAAARQAFDAARSVLERAGEQERDRRADVRRFQAAVENARNDLSRHEAAVNARLREASALEEAARRVELTLAEAHQTRSAAQTELSALPATGGLESELAALREAAVKARASFAEARAAHDGLEREARIRAHRLESIAEERARWQDRQRRASGQVEALESRVQSVRTAIDSLAREPERIEDKRRKLMSMLSEAEAERRAAADALAAAETAAREAQKAHDAAQDALVSAREEQARVGARLEAAVARSADAARRIAETLGCSPADVPGQFDISVEKLPAAEEIEARVASLRDQRERLGGVNLRADVEAEEVAAQLDGLVKEREDVVQAIAKLRGAISSLNREGRQRLLEAFGKVNESFGDLFRTLFGGGKAELQLVESEDPLEAGLEILAHPPGKRPQVLSLLSGGEQALTALALIFAVFLSNPSPICVLDEVDAPLDDHNVERFCDLLDAMLARTETRYLIITHHPLTMARMHRLYGVTMMERGVSQLVSVDLQTAEGLRKAG